MTPVLEIENLSLSYHTKKGETPAIENLSFSIMEGEFVSIVGPSGCGKSTLLSIIAGLLEPSGGNVFCEGLPEKEGCLSIGYMLQKDHLLEWRNILNNVLLGLEVQKKITKESIDFASALLDNYGLNEFKNYFPHQLSGGMRQRAALIRTLATKPKLLLLDEPFSALDYQTRLSVADEIGTIIKKEKKTALMVTHDISEAISLSDKVIVLSKRPATLKNIHEIQLSIKERTPLKSREAIEFKDYFNTIWKELDIHVT